MSAYYSVRELLADGPRQSDREITLTGWVWDRLEHCAIYDFDFLAATNHPDTKAGIWLRGNLPQRRTTRGDGPLHRAHVQVTGKFHWQPKSGAGHFNSWPAWIGVRSVERLAESDPDATPSQNEA
jgi:hypothetical protein